jgi:hypothetical protein
MALDMARKISFKPTSRRSSHVRTARDRLARHWTRDCALQSICPGDTGFRHPHASQKEANRAHARLRAPGERANAQLKSWRILRKLRCCPWRAGQLAKAIHVLQTRETGG